MAEPSRKRSKKRKPPLDTGDEIEFRISSPAGPGKGEPWVTFGVVSRVREGEEPADAALRIEEFVESELTDYIDAITENE